METQVTTIVPLATNEPIPGYILRQRLGSGGYGEVWEAEAPGGLKKAVKFVYGALEDVRAQRELKSLNRIKEVHHPFLLSLERIEVVDGRLIIVTELANGCLRKRFDECRRQGSEGVPREELLGYLRDVADALDFIHERHQLQHLDIKPENLLMVGNHIKVADFGLLKDLQETASLMGGMTPLYCPPEVLDGRPGTHSDQYSLAIVYQEMLTGRPPFGGRTTAQLAAQHLHSPPMLAVLPASDQPAVLRALSKSPDQRFPSCRAFIEALLQPSAMMPRKRSQNKRKGPAIAEPIVRTEVLGAAGNGNGPVGHSPQASTSPAAEVRSLPPVEIDGAQLKYHPTVIIGIGGAAGLVLSHLRRRLCDRFGNAESVPALQVLLFDTDVKALSAAMFKRGSGTVPGRNTLAIPLRPPKDYRADSREILEWLSRRWLYNIPRSLQTEGLRPLGRLAFVDHSPQILAQIERAVRAATDSKSLEESAGATGVAFESGYPRVFVVASVSGGTGSGAVIDLGYAVRKVLADLSISDEGVCGILMHSTGQTPEGADLAVANAVATLSELLQFSADGSCYPGDPACNLPAFFDRSAPFHDTYLVHLGEALSEQEHELATASIADYLYENTLSSSAPFFELARRQDGALESKPPISEGRLRTFGIVRLSPFQDNREQNIAETAQLSEQPAEIGAAAASRHESLYCGPKTGSIWDSGHSQDHHVIDETDTQVSDGDTCDVAKQNWWIERDWEEALPRLLAGGGSRRLCISAPSQIDRRLLAEHSRDFGGESATFVENDGRDIIVCHEVQDVPAEGVIEQLVGRRTDLYEIASRLHTRVDVEWDEIGG